MRTTLIAITACVVLSSHSARAGDARGTTIEDPSLFAGGVALATVGAASSIAGIVLIAVIAPINSQFAFFGDKPDVSGYFEVGIPMLVVGVLMSLGGIGMAIEGGKHVVAHVAFAPMVSPRGGSIGLAATF